MSGPGGKLSGLDRRPWTLALIAGAGLTLLLPSALALYGPLDLLDTAVQLGNARLAAGLAVLFVFSTGCLRFLLRRRRLPEEEVDDEPPLRHAAASRDVNDAPAAAPRAHLR
jgi:hypothetical protein